MSFRLNQIGNLEYWTTDVLDGTAHGFSTRLGGVSEGPLASLNLGVHRGDKPENVLKNYDIFGEAVGFSKEQTVFTKQEHTDVVRVVTEENCGEGLYRDVPEVCDALITDRPGVALTAFSADCVPILLYDPVRKAIGAVHAGWRGTAALIAAKAVEAMVREFGCDAENIQAAIGPAISRCCYETDRDVPEALSDCMGNKWTTAVTQVGQKYHVDLKYCNGLILQKAGIGMLDICHDCTCCHPDRYWSHRKVGDARGSMAAVIMLK